MSEDLWRFGPQVAGGGTVFRLWAPRAEKVELVLPDQKRRLGMAKQDHGWFVLEVPGAGHGTRYAFALDEDDIIPDPASPFQPDGVEGPSMVIDFDAMDWNSTGWHGRPWHEAVIYELHIGTFTPDGTCRAAIDKLDSLADLGITAIELMPVNGFPGRWGWSYDGVALFAPDPSYGEPKDLVAFVDAAHERGLMVYLDVVYNHFGPQGNVMPKAMPLLSEWHTTEFGTPPNLDGPGSEGVRRFLIENVLHWLERYRFDGLRIDASHELHDNSEPHFLAEMADTVRARLKGRDVHLILENSLNQVSWLHRNGEGKPLHFEAQWSDNIHHALHVATTGEQKGFYAAFDNPVHQLARALAEGCCFQGEIPVDSDKPLGEPSAHLPPTAFVAYLQNHDQAGNRPGGLRLGQEIPPEPIKAMAAVILLSPTIPTVFMGEEWNAQTPFYYFVDLHENLADPVRTSRQEMLAKWHSDVPTPDPFHPESFTRSKLDWSERDRAEHREMLEHYRTLLALRKRHLIPRLEGVKGRAERYRMLGERAFRVEWRLGDGAFWQMNVDFEGGSAGEVAEGADLIWHSRAGAQPTVSVLLLHT